jgi:hypothetical protein
MQTFEQKLRVILEPDVGPVNQAIDTLQNRLNQIATQAAAIAGGGSPTTTPAPTTPAPTTTTSTSPTRSRPSGSSFGGGAAFAAGNIAGIATGRAMGTGFLDIIRGRSSPFPILANALASTTGGMRIGQMLFGAHAMRSAMRAQRTAAAAHAARQPSQAIFPRIARFFGSGVGGVGPGQGALLGGGLAAAGAGMIVATGAIAVRQFVEGVKLYVQATQRIVTAVTGADPTQLLLAGTTAQQAATRLGAWKGAAAGALTGGAVGGVAGGVMTGPAGAVIGSLLGGGLGGLTGLLPSLVKGWFQGVVLRIQETLFTGLDNLFKRLENYNGVIFGLQRQFEMQQNIFLFKLGHAATELATAWFSLKVATLDLMTTIVQSGVLKPILSAIIAYLQQIQSELPQTIGNLMVSIGELGVAFLQLADVTKTLMTVNTSSTMTALLAQMTAAISNAVATAVATVFNFFGPKSPANPNQLPTTPPAANQGLVAPGFIGPLAPNQKTATGLMGIFMAMIQSGQNVMGMKPPTTQLGTLPMQTFAANFATLAFGKPGSQGYPVGRGQAGYPGISGLGAPASGAMLASQHGTNPKRGTTYSPNSAQQAAQQAAKAPTAVFPKFTQNIQMEFKAKLMHEQQVADSLNQVREKLLETLDVAGNEARLCVSMLDGRMQAFNM